MTVRQLDHMKKVNEERDKIRAEIELALGRKL